MSFSICLSQSIDGSIIEKLKRNVIYLSSDELEGRNTGSKSEKIAADYIIEKLKIYKVKPKGTKGFFQKFTAKKYRQCNSELFTPNLSCLDFISYLNNEEIRDNLDISNSWSYFTN